MVRTREAHLDLSEFYDPARRQYNGDMLLRKVDNLFDSGTLKNLGLFNVDLFIPILTFIFGQAHLGGRSGIASSYRLHNERYGLAKDPDLLAERLIKEVIHELGHTFGLIHCPVPSCVMQSSTYVEHIDQKESHLCMGCRKLILRNSCPGSVSL
jgi:archaemetzincin